MSLAKFAKITDSVQGLREASKNILQEACQELLDAVPEIEKVSFWVQIPYFNDGDLCTPRASGLSAAFTNEAIKTIGNGREYVSIWTLKSGADPRGVEIAQLMEQADKVLRDVPTMILLLGFDKKATITRNSFIIEDFQDEG